MPEIYLVFLLFSFLLFTGLRIFPMWKKDSKPGKITLNQISVVIPFRNEEKNLPELLSSILLQDQFPNEILFVNDHSDDESITIIQTFIDKQKLGNLFSLPVEKTGKKSALAYGVQKAESRYILTLDADVVLNIEYFNSYHLLNSTGLSSLPVKMKGKGFLGKLFSTEYSFFNAFNFLISSIWPISVSGANLLFDSKLMNYDQQLESHQHLASGDDYFLLKNFRNNNLPIHIRNDHSLSVETAAPNSLKAYFDQRVRWLSKSKYQVDWVDSLIGLFVLLYFVGGIIALFSALINGLWLILICVFVLRFLIDVLVYLNYSQKLKYSKNVLILPLFQIVYPILFILVALLAVFYKPKWKGRF
ncbi:glycosyltransferase [Brumimicrobium mesophilum]|uniref:glycosyltransferase n=1 Tax=Brumimicrobium mesophilum TaxID=392717 RepID=UPI00131D8900|nr:glycosyltransferase [Brumimicrobium mesophilum]